MNEPLLEQEDTENVLACMRSGWISSAGPQLAEFEQRWAAYCGMPHGLAVSNGTAALQLAVRALGIGPGDEVVMPAFTIISCALAVAEAGAVPVLVDADPRTWCMDVAAVEARITARTRALMAVHIYGHPTDMDALCALAARHRLPIIEDAAEAHGARVRVAGEWRVCGGLGAVGTFSFYANKLVTTGEGGMVLARDPVVAERVASLRNLCFGRAERFRHEDLGWNFRMTNLQAAVGLGQIARIERIVDRKRALAARYRAGLAGVRGLALPVEEPWARSVYWMFGVVLDDAVPLDAAAFAEALRTRGVETRPFFLGMHEQPALQKRGWFRGERHPVSERIARRGLYLPSGLALTEQQVDTVCAAVAESLA